MDFFCKFFFFKLVEYPTYFRLLLVGDVHVIERKPSFLPVLSLGALFV